jgi:hypothetical protein
MRSIKEAAQFYIEQGFRPMPTFGVQEGCRHRPVKPELDCKGQCWGKVPKIEHWPDHDIFGPEHFDEATNLALIMGKQLDGRWFLGIDVDGDIDLNEFLLLPETLECKTNRGKHLIFEVTPDSPLGNWNDIFSTRSEYLGYRSGYYGAVDIKYCRGAFISPPSKTKVGGFYEWKEWRQPAELPESEILYLIRKRKFSHPKVKRYRKWSDYPSHEGKNP